MAKKSIQIESEAHKAAKHLSTETGFTIGEIIEMLIAGKSEKEIRKLGKEKEKSD